MILTILVLSCLSLQAEQQTDSVRVYFKVNKTIIDTLLMDNDAAMRGFAHRISNLSDRSDTSDKSDVSVKIERILITGAASPEGSVPYNKWLSERRAEAITRWLQGYFEFPDSIVSFVFKGRDWAGALAMVEADPDVPYKNEVIDLLIDIKNTADTSAGRDGMARLKSLRGGVPYRYMLRNHFPRLRASEVFITAEITHA